MKLNEIFKTDILPDVQVGSVMDFEMIRKWHSTRVYKVELMNEKDGWYIYRYNNLREGVYGLRW